MAWPILFLFGIAVGSFLNVLAVGYKDGGRIFSWDILTGRSRCPHCGKNLRWYELIPLVSFLIQGGKCRHCHALLNWQYPVVELISGLLFVFVPLHASPAWLWLLVALALLLLSLIDLRLYIIPDQIQLFLLSLGLASLIQKGIGDLGVWQSPLFGAFAGAAIFGFIVLLTKGRGMGLGDVKLAAVLGFLFGWPQIILITGLSFAVGGIFAMALLLMRRKNMKDVVPFGPFLAGAAILVLFCGNAILNLYGF